MKGNNVVILNSKKIFSSYLDIYGIYLKFKLFNGNWSNIVYRELFSRGGIVAVILYDKKQKKIVFIEQFRIGAFNNSIAASPWLIEPVAGIIEKTEYPKNAAIRETKEETGFDIKNLKYLFKYFSSPGISSEEIFLFSGEVDLKKIITKFHGTEDNDEDIKIHVIELNEIEKYLEEKTLLTSLTVISLQWILLNKETLFL